MKRIFHILVNPDAGGGRGAKTAKQIIELLKKYRYTYFIYTTEYPGHEIELTQMLIQTKKITPLLNEPVFSEQDIVPIFVVIGGDGTLHQVLNQLHAYSTRYPVAYIKAGSGNDFARAFRMTKTPEEAFWKILEQTAPVKIPILRYQEAVTNQTGVFCNNLGIGLDGKIVKKVNHSKRKKWFHSLHIGKTSYFSSILTSFFQQRPFPIRVEFNGQERIFRKTLLFTVTNHPYFGGGIAIAPHADLKDDSFKLVVVQKTAFFKLVHLFYLILRKKQLRSRYFKHYSLKKLRVITTTPQDVHLDGESFEGKSYDLTITLTSQFFW